jgi:hypothetical protein
MRNCISGCEGLARITTLKVMTVTRGIPSLPPASDHGLLLNSRGFIWEPGKSRGIGAKMAKIRMQMRRKKQIQADDGLAPTLEYSGYSTRECDQWVVYFIPVKYDNGEAIAMASDVSEAKTVL